MSANRTHTDNHRWITPKEITDALGEFDLDPCIDICQPWLHARKSWSTLDDGLAQEWSGRVWLNPPYGRETWKWLARLSEHGDGIALVFARTETRMFHEHVWPRASGVLFLAGRPHFYRPTGERAKGNSGGPLVLIAYGDRNADCLESCPIPGAFIRLKRGA